MGKFVSENFAKRSAVCNIILSFILFVPVIMVMFGMTLAFVTALWYAEQSNLVECAIIEVNGIIALFAVYGFVLRNKRNALIFGITTLYSILIFVCPFFTTASDSMTGLTAGDYRDGFYGSFIVGFVVCLIVLAILLPPMLIRKNGKSALSLLECGGVITNAKVEFIVVIVSNLALIVTAYTMVLSEMKRLGSM